MPTTNNSCSNYVKYVLAPKQANPCSCCYNQNPNQNITINCENNGGCAGGGGGNCGACGGCVPEFLNDKIGQVLQVTDKDGDGVPCLSWEDNVGEKGDNGENGEDGYSIFFRPWTIVTTTEDGNPANANIVGTNVVDALDNLVSVWKGSEQLEYQETATANLTNGQWNITSLESKGAGTLVFEQVFDSNTAP